MDAEYFLQIAAELNNLANIRRFIQDSAAQLQADSDAISDVVLAVDEAVNNIIVHGYRSRAGIIEVALKRIDSRLVVCLRDQAPTFDPTNLPMPDINLPLEKRPLGGMGVYLVMELMDKVSYRRTDNGNELTLEKRIASSD
jgi:serine/threonine-protein kinase RsbW